MPRVVDAPDWPRVHRWPVAIRYGQLRLTPFTRRDLDEITLIRNRNVSWLSPWDATSPTAAEHAIGALDRVRRMTDAARRGTSLPWVLRWDEARKAPIIGQCTVSNITYGSVQSCTVGYWIDKAYAGRGLMPLAVALAADYAMRTLSLHRVEICIRPENTASLRVVQKLGFRYEGRRPRYIHIAGAWRDHEVFALTPEEVPEGLLARVKV